jgi:predicted kinase
MARSFFVQMSGCPGAGKSTIARAIGQRTGAVVIDHDVLKSALLAGGMSFGDAGRMAYETARALARSVLDQGLNVVLDSPCFYQEIVDADLRIAAETGACFRYIECVTDDLAEISRRLRDRTPLRSQRRDLGVASSDLAQGSEAPSGEALFREWIANMKRPPHSCLRVDTTRPLAECLDVVFAFLAACD